MKPDFVWGIITNGEFCKADRVLKPIGVTGPEPLRQKYRFFALLRKKKRGGNVLES
ncbi:MAG: hypothetical protein Roseis3KO_42860 [Roseivirga sp.]